MKILNRKAMEKNYTTSKLTLLELTRALVKVGETRDRIESSFEFVDELFRIGALGSIPIDEVIYLSRELEIDLNLYASDAIHVASAIQSQCKVLWSEDDHHTKKKTKDYLKKYDIEVRTLNDI